MKVQYLLRLISVLALFSALHAQETSELDHDRTQVSILGYHEFSSTKKETEMRISTDKFRRQMQTIRSLGIPVIPMEDFIAWKKGEKNIPQRSIVITIDDGWRSVYTDAYPILKELNFPFTVYLYKDYIHGGGRSMSIDMIKEMQENGASIGSHSISHPLPGTIKKHRARNAEHFDAYLRAEMGKSKDKLEELFGSTVNTYAYPGGFTTPEMFTVGQDLGYDAMFTVFPGKIRKDSPDHSLSRYVILGTHDHIFESATTFVGANLGTSNTALAKDLPFPVTPQAGSMIEQRLPKITADLSELSNIDPDSLSMLVSGFGQVPATYEPITKLYSWTVSRPLRLKSCDVTIKYRLANTPETPAPVRWSFMLDLEAAYLPQK